MLMLHWHDIVGFCGIAMILAAYLLLQIDFLRSDSLVYSLLNGLGASCVIFSLFFDFNLSAFLMEAFWVIISLIGIVRYVTRKRQSGLELRK
ncbi:MAG: hypothetical protein DF168_02230 [Candidatus Moanabacter tarae]|uniref:CBU-0592-like domain-containing protein n=1 Tax=Candidatus Moanibacter tarae TaxID=2200854 RepID=A0A2Z4AH11_9BACT|nr:MAG: hypothetical protein DF168_02230 [Candidatus Moanabacter tarae]